jgi:hypothetical protein
MCLNTAVYLQDLRNVTLCCEAASALPQFASEQTAVRAVVAAVSIHSSVSQCYCYHYAFVSASSVCYNWQHQLVICVHWALLEQ